MKNKISKRLVISAAVATLVFALSCLCLFFGLFYKVSDGESVSFPDYVGSREEDIPDASGFEVQKNYVYSDTHEKGIVVSQYPEGLSVRKIKAGHVPVINVNISLGRESFVLDELSGKSLSDARAYLLEYTCKIKIIRLYGDFEREYVSASKPSAGQRVSSNDTVVLYVSTPSPKEFLKVPEISGLSLDEGIRLLREQGFMFGLEEGYDASKEDGVILSQSIPPHTYKEKNTVIKITVNTE